VSGLGASLAETPSKESQPCPKHSTRPNYAGQMRYGVEAEEGVSVLFRAQGSGFMPHVCIWGGGSCSTALFQISLVTLPPEPQLEISINQSFLYLRQYNE